jgi:hypothetical protein
MVFLLMKQTSVMILRICGLFTNVVYETRIQEKLQSGKRPANVRQYLHIKIGCHAGNLFLF